MATEIEGKCFGVRRLQGEQEAEACARLMASSEPWITLGRGYEASLKLMKDPTREVYVAFVGEELVGFIIILMQEAFTGYIQSLGVAPAWRNKGIGSQLLKFAEKRIFDETPNVFMCVSSFNKDAKRLYERVGYEVIGELADYILPGHSEFLLRKSIAPLAGFKGRSI